MQWLLVTLVVLQIYIRARGGASAGPVEREACPGGNCDSSYSFNNDDVLIRKQRYSSSGPGGGPGGTRTDSDRDDDSDGVQIETLEWDEDDVTDGAHFHDQSDIYKAALLHTNPEDDQPVQKPPLAENDLPADDENPVGEDLDKFKARSAPMAEDKVPSDDSTGTNEDSDDEEKTITSKESEDEGSSQNKDVEPKKKKRKSGKRNHDDFRGLHFHRMSSLYQTVMTKGELEEEEEEVKGSEVTGQSNEEGQDDNLDDEDLDLEGSKNGDEIDKDKDNENGPEDAEDHTDTTDDEDKDLNVEEKSSDGSEDKESSQNKDLEPKKKRRKRDTGKRNHDDFRGLHFHRMSSLYQTIMTKGELEEEEEEVKGSEFEGQDNDELQQDDKESETTDEDNDGPCGHECTDENCPFCKGEKQETSEDKTDEAFEEEGTVEDGGGEKNSGGDGGGAKSNGEDDGRAKNNVGEVTDKETDQQHSEEKLDEEQDQNKDEHETESVEDDTPINVKDYISRMLVKYRDERLVHTHTDDP
ncbi:spore wall protein 2-like [Branchiostoma floridae]|uniref:Spore wall protein 2-like n=1 Tax=Branchiostoma floridae TaxID=7739 RepID=A0A9J7M358_BRAFL|nr:spore wall protein 2-like [Branchiostoma floridae]